MNFLRWIGAVAVLVCITIPVQADDRLPSQQHNSGSCGEDTKCLTLWYFEYKEAITEELVFWRQFENDIADSNMTNALSDLNQAMKNKRYKHYYWNFYRGGVFQIAGQPETEALTWSCRDAIIGMKYMLIAVSDGNPLTQGDPGSYLREVRKCEQQFRLPKFDSRLRRF